MYNIEASKSNLCRGKMKKLYYWNELPIDMLPELVDLFICHGGKVADQFAVSMTSKLDSMKRGRKFICIEKNEELFHAALGRLRNLLLPTLQPAGAELYSKQSENFNQLVVSKSNT